MSSIRIVRGLADTQLSEAAHLYMEAFDQKLGPILGRDDRAVAFLAHVMRKNQALVALDPDSEILGLAGFHDAETGLIGGEFRDLSRFYGWFGAAWRVLLLSIFERAPVEGEFLMDGIVVGARARGKGVGSALLAAILETARSNGASQVRLDVIDTNPRARALYERVGFVARKTEHYGIFTKWLGFSAATTMICDLDHAAEGSGPPNST